MLEFKFKDASKYGSFMLIIMSILFIVVSGIFLGVIHYTLSSVQTSFESTNCVISNNTLVESCQDLWELALYPFLGLKDIIVGIHTFLIFGLILGMLFLGYKSGRSPFLLGIMIFLIIILTYFGIEASNIYRTFLENAIFRDVMMDFTLYNRIMLNFPWFVFIISLFSTLLGVVNYQKTRVNQSTAEDLDF